MAWRWMDSRDVSGWQLASICGRGLPTAFFRPVVIRSVVTALSPRPSHPVFHSQSFLRNSKPHGTLFDALGPGTQTNDTIKMIMAGPTMAASVRLEVETRSPLNGYEMLRSTSEKG